MRKVLYAVSLLLMLVAGCSKESHVQKDTSLSDDVGKIVEFKLTSLTKVDDKVAWIDGDLVAIFKQTDSNYSQPFFYEVTSSEDGTIAPIEGGEPIIFDGEADVYHAFFAGDQKLESFDEYNGLKSENNLSGDYLYCVTSASSNDVDLVFDHISSKLTFNFSHESINDVTYDAEFVLLNEDRVEIVSNESASSATKSIYVAPKTSLTDQMGVAITWYEGEHSIKIYLTFDSIDDIKEWKAGSSYTYNIPISFVY